MARNENEKEENMKIENRMQRLEEVRGERADGVKGGTTAGGLRERAAGSQSGMGLPHSKTWRSSERADRNVGVTNVGVTSEHVQNTDGFWELSFAGQRAVLPQHQGLFYIAYLLTNPHAAPIPGTDLVGEVFGRYGEHEDFRPPIPKGCRNDARVAKILLRKEKRLEAVVDREGEEDFVRIEALRELMVLDELKRIYFSEIAREARNAGDVLSDTLRELHVMLANAVDVRGEPHGLIRDFAMHLLHYVLMPSERVSARERVTLFVYRPAVEGN
jgi:hypothetical protein